MGFTLEQSGDIRIEILDLQGRIIDMIQLGNLTPGHYVKEWNNDMLESGTYILRIISNNTILDQHQIQHL